MELLEQRIQKHVPTFLHGEIVFCDKLFIDRKRYFIVLARNLKLYKFYHKQVINLIDLSKTCLEKISQQIYDYKGPKGKWVRCDNMRSSECMGNTKHGGLMETIELQSNSLLEKETNAELKISFGKYVYRNFDICKVYFLIQSWDKLVVITFPDYTFVTEYEGVKGIRIVHGKVKFIAMLEIQFENCDIKCTDFQTNEENSAKGREIQSTVFSNERNSFRKLLERVRCAKAELQIHKSATQKEFDILQDMETHGCNYIRSEKLEEKPMISRCGDIWSRFVKNDILVFGVPLVNNCSASSLTILKNLKPILKVNELLAENIFYEYRLYQLRVKFEEMETMETFFQTEDEEFSINEHFWVDCKLTQLLPASFAVLLIAIKTSEILLLKECPMFLYFEIEKDQLHRPGYSSVKTKVYEQHLFLKNINVSYLLMNREKYVVSFDTKGLHQDFLATAMSNRETTLYIEFTSTQNAFLFEHVICKKLHFKTIDRNSICKEVVPSESKVRISKTNQKQITSGICFNNDPTSFWFGSMVVKTTPCMGDDAQIWKLYLCSKEKVFFCLKILFNELTLVDCDIKHMKYVSHKHNTPDTYTLDVKNALSSELEYLKNFNECNDAALKRQIFVKLMKMQINSDILLVIV